LSLPQAGQTATLASIRETLEANKPRFAGRPGYTARLRWKQVRSPVWQATPV
jgi:hypothetical protein